MEARRQSHPEEVEARPEATKAFQYPLVARPELVEVTKAHPESEDPEVVHHPEMAEPEESEAHRPAFHHHHPAASLHHHRELLAPPVRGLAGCNSDPDVRPEMACCWDDVALTTLALCPELV